MIRHIKASDVPPAGQRKRKETYADRDLRDFMETSAEAGEIVIPAGNTFKQVKGMYERAIKKGSYPARVLVRGDKLYIQKIREDEKK